MHGSITSASYYPTEIKLRSKECSHIQHRPHFWAGWKRFPLRKTSCADLTPYVSAYISPKPSQHPKSTLRGLSHSPDEEQWWGEEDKGEFQKCYREWIIHRFLGGWIQIQLPLNPMLRLDHIFPNSPPSLSDAKTWQTRVPVCGRPSWRRKGGKLTDPSGLSTTVQ